MGIENVGLQALKELYTKIISLILVHPLSNSSQYNLFLSHKDMWTVQMMQVYYLFCKSF